MTNPVYLTDLPAQITAPGLYVLPGGQSVQSGFDYTVWISGTFSSCTAQVRWIDSRGYNNAFEDSSPEGSPFSYLFSAPPSGGVAILVAGTGTCDLLVELCKKQVWRL